MLQETERDQGSVGSCLSHGEESETSQYAVSGLWAWAKARESQKAKVEARHGGLWGSGQQGLHRRGQR